MWEKYFFHPQKQNAFIVKHGLPPSTTPARWLAHKNQIATLSWGLAYLDKQIRNILGTKLHVLIILLRPKPEFLPPLLQSEE